MSKSGGTTKSLSTSGPPEFQYPFIKKGLDEAGKLYDQGGPQLPSTSLIAPWSPQETQARGMATEAATNALPQLSSDVNNAFKFGTTTALDPNSNPYFQSATKAAIAPVFEQLTESVLPNIRNEFVNSGGYGGTRQSLAESLATKAATQSALNTTSQMGSNAYNQGLNTFLQTLSQAPMVGQMALQPASTLASVGAQEREMDASKRAEEYQRSLYGNTLPYQNLAEYMNMISRPFGGSYSGTSVAPETGGAEQIAGMGLSLIPILQSIFSIFK